jgi:hypothetical protein
MIAAIMVHQQGRKSHTYFYECGTRQQTMELHDVIICRVQIVTEDGTKSTRPIVAVRVLRKGRNSHTYFYLWMTRQQTMAPIQVEFAAIKKVLKIVNKP